MFDFNEPRNQNSESPCAFDHTPFFKCLHNELAVKEMY